MVRLLAFAFAAQRSSALGELAAEVLERAFGCSLTHTPVDIRSTHTHAHVHAHTQYILSIACTARYTGDCIYYLVFRFSLRISDRYDTVTADLDF
jgi:hypothetical protein